MILPICCRSPFQFEVHWRHLPHHLICCFQLFKVWVIFSSRDSRCYLTSLFSCAKSLLSFRFARLSLTIVSSYWLESCPKYLVVFTKSFKVFLREKFSALMSSLSNSSIFFSNPVVI